MGELEINWTHEYVRRSNEGIEKEIRRGRAFRLKNIEAQKQFEKLNSKTIKQLSI